jgi:hypothetical protein
MLRQVRVDSGAQPDSGACAKAGRVVVEGDENW